MIQAIKNSSLTGVQVRTLNIRQKELQFWKTTFETMAGQSALLTGFCYGGLSISTFMNQDTKEYKDLDSELAFKSPLHFMQSTIAFGFLASTTLAMGFGLLTIITSSLCSMLGPGLALRGSEGALSMHKAVDTMKDESTNCFYFFMLQLLFFHISSFLLMWMIYSASIAIVVNVVLLIFLVVFIINGFDIVQKLHINEDDAISGKFQDFSQYENMNDLDTMKQNDYNSGVFGGQNLQNQQFRNYPMGEMSQPVDGSYVQDGSRFVDEQIQMQQVKSQQPKTFFEMMMGFGSAIAGQSAQSSSNNNNRQLGDRRYNYNNQFNQDRPRSAQMNVVSQKPQRGLHKTKTTRMDNQAYSGDFQQEGGIRSKQNSSNYNFNQNHQFENQQNFGQIQANQLGDYQQFEVESKQRGRALEFKNNKNYRMGRRSNSRSGSVSRSQSPKNSDIIQQQIGLSFNPGQNNGQRSRSRQNPQNFVRNISNDRNPAGPQSSFPDQQDRFLQEGRKSPFRQQSPANSGRKNSFSRINYIGPPSPKAQERSIEFSQKNQNQTSMADLPIEMASKALSGISEAFGNILNPPSNIFGQNKDSNQRDLKKQNLSPHQSKMMQESKEIFNQMRQKALEAQQKKMQLNALIKERNQRNNSSDPQKIPKRSQKE